MLKLKMGICVLATAFCQTSMGQEASKHHPPTPGSTVKATTECRAGCQGSTTGCQESWESAVLAASPGLRLYKSSLTMSKSTPGSDTTGLVKEPQWDISSVPAGDDRPVSITVKPVIASCEGSDAHKQSRTHYEWMAVQGPK